MPLAKQVLVLGCLLVGLMPTAAHSQQPQVRAMKAAGAIPGAIAGEREFSGRLIVRPRSMSHWQERGLDAAQARNRRAAAESRIARDIIRRHDEVDEFIIAVPALTSDAAFAAQLFATGDYQYVEPDWIVHAVAVPNDPQYPQQWHLPKINAPAAWNLTTGSPSVIVAICDSGIDLDHPDLAGALVSGFNAVDNLPQSQGGQVDGLTNHGTQVAGCAGAIGNNAVGVSGVGWNLRLMPIRVSNLPNDTAAISDINNGARWAVDHGAKVINASFSSVQTASVQTTGEYIRNAGGVYVWAAGNAASSLGAIDHADVVIIGATNPSDQRASFSNFGRAIDVVAPGTDILTTSLGSYAPNNGTSFASPIAAGALGLIWSINPALSSRAAETVLEVSAHDIGAAGEDDEFGFGRIDAAAAAQLAQSAATSPLPPIAFDDRAAALETSQITIGVLNNDIDLNGQAISICNFPAVTAGGAALTLVNTGNPLAPHALQYQADADFEGLDNFTYIVCDPGNLTDTANVQVGVAHAIAFAPPQTVNGVGPGTPTNVSAFDLDGDGDLDLIGNYLDTLTTLRFYRNDGEGNFTHVGGIPLSSFSRLAITFGQFVGDSHIDIAFVEQLANRFGVAQGHGNFTFDAPVITTMNSVNGIAGADADGHNFDFNNDGRNDVAVSHNGFPPSVEILLNNGNGTFTPAGSLQTIDTPALVIAANVNADPKPEIIMGGAGLGDLVVIRVGNAGQILSSQTFSTGTMMADLTAFDVDGDDDLDLASVSTGVLGATPGVRVLRNNGLGVFGAAEVVNATGDFPQGLAAADFDADGDGDLATANLLSNNVSVYPGLAGGVMLGVSALLPTPVGAHDVTAGDFDNDGDIDLAAMLISSPAQRIFIYENLTDPTAPAVPGDANGDGHVDVDDLIAVILAWGACPAPENCPADVNHSGNVDVDDLIMVILTWG